MTEAIALNDVDRAIFTVRGHKVILDSDLARIYGVEVKRLNEQVKRNRTRFPEDFAFPLVPQEVVALRSQIATLKRGQHRKYAPYAFTEHGAIMAATVLNSSKAVEMSVFVVRVFVKMREQLLATATLAKRLAEVEKLLLTHDSALRDLYQKIRPLLLPPAEPERKRIGFGVKERRAIYRAAVAVKRARS
jgi:phage regulator Rha-like protein